MDDNDSSPSRNYHEDDRKMIINSHTHPSTQEVQHKIINNDNNNNDSSLDESFIRNEHQIKDYQSSKVQIRNDSFESNGCVCEVQQKRQQTIDEIQPFCPHHTELSNLIDSRINIALSKLPVHNKGRKSRKFWDEAYKYCMELIEEVGYISPSRVKLHPWLVTYFYDPHQMSRLRAQIIKRNKSLVVFRIRQPFSPYYITQEDKLEEVKQQLNHLIRQRKSGGFP